MALEVISPSTNRASPSTELLPMASSVPIGQRGRIYVRGRNDMPTSQKLGVHWVVKDPDGLIVENYKDWELGSTGPSDTHDFDYHWFDLNKEGTYTIAVSLLMNPDSPVIVDSYEGDLCTTAIEVPPVPPEEEKKFPWTPVLIGTGAVIAIAGLAAAKRR